LKKELLEQGQLRMRSEAGGKPVFRASLPAITEREEMFEKIFLEAADHFLEFVELWL